MDNDLSQLYRFVVGHYDQEELRTLCFDLGVDYDSLPAQGKAAKARELILVLGRRHRLASLVTSLHKTHADLLAEIGLQDDGRTAAMLQAQLAAFERRTPDVHRMRRPPYFQTATPTYIRPRRSGRRRTIAVAVILLVLGGFILSILTQPWSPSAQNLFSEPQPTATLQASQPLSGSPMSQPASIESKPRPTSLPLNALWWIAQILVSSILLLAAVAELSGWNVRELWGAQPVSAGAEAFPFHVVRDFDELLDYLFPDPSLPRLPDRAIPFLPRIADRLDAAFLQRGRVLIRGRSKTGKTREAVEMLRRWWHTGPTVLLAKHHVGLYPPYAIPDTLPIRNMVLFFDDVDRYCGDADAVQRLDETIDFFADLCHHPEEMRVVATIRQEPEFWSKLRYEEDPALWQEFELAPLAPLSLQESQHLLEQLAEITGLEITPSAATDIARKNDGTFLALILSFRGWLEEGLQRVGAAQAAAFEGRLVSAWRERYRRLVKAMPAAGPIYAAAALFQRLDVPLQPELVADMATEMQLSRGYHLLAGLLTVASHKIQQSPEFNWCQERRRDRRWWAAVALLAIAVLYLVSYLLLRFVPPSLQFEFFNTLAAELWLQLLLLSPLFLLLMPLGLSLLLRWYRRRVRQHICNVLNRLLETEVPLRGNELRPYENQFEGNGASRAWGPDYYGGQASSVLFRRLVAPRLATVYWSWAEELRLEGELGPARSLVRLARSLAPAHPTPAFLMGQLWYDEGQIRRALVEFTRSQELGATANAARTLERMAWCLYHTAEYGPSEKVADQALALRANLASARWARGLARLQQGQIQAGLEDCRKAAQDRERVAPELEPALDAALAKPSSRGWARRVSRLFQQDIQPAPRHALLRRKLTPRLALGMLALSILAFMFGVPYMVNRMDEDARFSLWLMDVALTLYPETPVLRVQRGWAHAQLNEYERGITDLTAAIQRAPEEAIAYQNRGWIYLQLDEYDRAIADYTKAIQLAPDEALSYTMRGWAYDNLGKHERVILDCTEAIRLNPEEDLAYHNRGWAYIHLGQYEPAVPDLTEAIRLNPAYASAFAGRGWARIKLDEYERAIEDLTEAIGLLSEYAWAYDSRGYAYRQLGDYQAAIADYTVAIELEPDNDDAYYSRGMVYQESGAYERAIKDYREALLRDPEESSYYRSFSEIYREMNATDRGMAELTELVRLHPEINWAYDQLGRIWQELGSIEAAIDNFNEISRANPKAVGIYKSRAQLYRERGDYAQSIQDYTAAIKLAPDGADAYAARGSIYRQMGQYERAITDYKAAIRRDGEESSYYSSLSDVFQEMGEMDRGIAELTQLLYQYSESAFAYRVRGDLYREKGAYQNAIADYKQALLLDPNGFSCYNRLDMTYREMGAADRGLAELTELVSLYSEVEWDYGQLGNILRNLGGIRAGITALTQIKLLNPREAGVHRARGNLYQELGDYGRAIEDYDEAIRRQSEGGDASKTASTYGERGDTYRQLGEYENAIADYQEAIRLDAEEYQYSITLGEIYLKTGQVDRGIAELTALLQREPENAVAYKVRGNLYRAKGTYETALADYKRAIRLDPQEPGHYDSLREVYRELGALDRGVAELTELVSLYPKPEIDWDYDELLRILRQLGGIKAARSALREIIHANPRQAEGHKAFGDLYRDMGDYERAIESYTEAIQLRPDMVSAYSARGIAHTQLGEYEQAVADYREAIRLEPKEPWYYSALRSLYQEMEQIDRGIAEVTAVLQRNPENAVAYKARGDLYREKNAYEDALADYKQAVRLELEGFSHHHLSSLYQEMGALERGVAEMTELLNRNPENALAHAVRGALYQEKEAYERALTDYEAALHLDPDTFSFYLVSHIYEEIGEMEQGVAELVELVSLHPESDWNYAALANTVRQIGGRRPAITAFTELVHGNPADTRLLIARGELYRDVGEHEHAIADYTEAIQLDPDGAAAYYGRGATYRMLGEPVSALADFRSYLELKPDAWNREEIEDRIAELEARLAGH